MNTKLNISFDLNPDTLEVSNLIVSSSASSENTDGIYIRTAEDPVKEKKPRKSKSKKDQDVIILEDNKLVLTQKLLDLIQAEPGDRLLVSFKEDNGLYYPLISKSEVFADSESGNKLTKSLTLSYRGKQRDQLLIYGTKFTFEETAEGSGVCKLIGEKEVKADDKVIKSNKDIVSFDLDEDVKDTSKKTYTRELKAPFEVSLEGESDFEIPGDLDINLTEINDEEFSKLLN